MPSLRRPARPAEQTAAAERVRGLLRDTTVGWVPPPAGAGAGAATGERAGGATRTGPLAVLNVLDGLDGLDQVDRLHDHNHDHDDDGGPARGGWSASPPPLRGRHAAPAAGAWSSGPATTHPYQDARAAASGGAADPQQDTETETEPDRDAPARPRSAGVLAAPHRLLHEGVQLAPSQLAPARPGPTPADGEASERQVAEPPPSLEPQEPSAGPLRLTERLRQGRLDPGRRGVVGLALVGLLACVLAGLLVVRSAPEEVALPAVEQAGRSIEGSTLPVATAPPAGAPPAGAAAAATGAGVAEVVVAVAGTVRRPGLVRLATGSRVDDAVRAAGGLMPGASTGLLNLARPVVDGEQVLVGVEPPPGADPPAGPAGPGAAAGPAGSRALVDLNTATVADLDRLPGIGPVLAERILEYRTRNGPFRSVDQLREVPGIGEAKFSSLRDAVTV